jgi:hypothetical protein
MIRDLGFRVSVFFAILLSQPKSLQKPIFSFSVNAFRCASAAKCLEMKMNVHYFLLSENIYEEEESGISHID